MPLLKSNRAFYVLLALLVFCLTLGVRAEPENHQSTDWFYTLRPSDSLQSVAQQLLDRRHSWTDLSQYNQISNASSLQAGSIIKVPLEWLKQQPQPASVLSISGSVLIKRSQNSQFSLVKPETQIRVGDELATRSGTAIIKFADGSLLHVDANTSLVFNRLSHFGNTGMVDTRVRLKQGSVSSDIQPLVKGSRFEISTPSAVAAVRGTRFRISTEADGTKLEVTEGKVEFSHEHGMTVVNAGEGARIRANSALIERKPLPPAPESQFAGTTVSDLPATLSWESTVPAENYRYQLNKQGQTAPPVLAGQTREPQIEIDNIRNGDYTVAMRAVDAEGFEGMDANSPLKVQVDTEIAELLAPLDGSTVDQLRPTFRWTFEDENVLGRLEISRDAEFNELVSDYDFAKNQTVTLSGELEPGDYFWRVSSIGDDNRESQSPARKLAVRGKMPPVRILSVNYIGNQVGLFWNTLDQASGYVLQVGESPAFNSVLKEEALGKNSAHLKLTPGKRYYARVKGIGNDRYRSEYGPTKELFIAAPQE